ncbi:hypothetical protein MKX01_025849, partial [Papaver californicum]
IEDLGDKPSFISHIGDISYARVTVGVPYHVCIGNHEYEWPLQPWKPYWSKHIYVKDRGGECGVPYNLKFSMHGNSSSPTGTRAPATRNPFYSFDSGVMHFVYFSTETNFLPGKTVNRTKTSFVVVQGHRPMYTTSHEYRDVPLRSRMLEHYEPLFMKNKVTLAIWGHIYVPYRRIWVNTSVCYQGKITLTFIGNHDGEPHNIVKMLPLPDVLLGFKRNRKRKGVDQLDVN